VSNHLTTGGSRREQIQEYHRLNIERCKTLNKKCSQFLIGGCMERELCFTEEYACAININPAYDPSSCSEFIKITHTTIPVLYVNGRVGDITSNVAREIIKFVKEHNPDGLISTLAVNSAYYLHSAEW